MYVVTFYSFKGGVGRSMALINIACEMVKAGSRVLVVDFDLEAPGIETFNLPRPESKTKGVVDFVSAYISSGTSPEIKDYVYRSPIQSGSTGQLWIMPAGLQDSEYSARLNSISWRQLYTDRSGYLLFEDLKAQWKQYLAPDYVLIDSRTGYTDEAGICTRQLPDAVVCLFFPNEQNLEGLRKIVTRIRNEKETARQKHIQLFFVNSNVPDLDDVDQILEKRLTRFKDQLRYETPPSTIHHYNNLSLLNQVIFTLDLPRSRLAAEYRALLAKIRRFNIEDREGSLEYLNHFQRMYRDVRHVTHDKPEDFEARLQKMHESHRGDGEILFRLAAVRLRQGRLEDSAILLDEAIAAGNNSCAAYMRRADVAQRLGNKSIAIECIRKALAQKDADFFDVRLGIRWLRDLNSLDDVIASPAVVSLSDGEILNLSQEHLSFDDSSLKIGEKLLRYRMDKEPTPQLISGLLLNLIGQRRSREAIHLISNSQLAFDKMNQKDSFNYAMANWAIAGGPAREHFERVLKLDDHDTEKLQYPNYAQCLSIANWVMGETTRAKELLDVARQRIMSHPSPEFSCWRYRTVELGIFLRDLDEIERLLKGEDIKPRFVAKHFELNLDGNSND
jgi:MinD-like ATPase involved in chromosome partitioning or flagellar assembly